MDTDYKVISSIGDVDLDWLKSIIDQRFPNSGGVTGFSIEASESTNASTAIINLEYANIGQAGSPKTLFLKFCKVGNQFIKDSEIFYYTRDYARLEEPPIPLCYDAQYSRSKGNYHILLEDLSKTHFSNKDVQPTFRHSFSVAGELARLHAFRWGSRADEIAIDRDSGKQISQFIRHITAGLEPILKTIKSDIPSGWADTILKIFDKHPEIMKQRARMLAGQTLLHGDPNPSNILSPNKESGKTYIIDRQPFTWSITYWLGVYDLVYMSTPFWDTESRRTLEIPMLKQYYKSLIDFGVTDYSWDQCKKKITGFA